MCMNIDRGIRSPFHKLFHPRQPDAWHAARCISISYLTVRCFILLLLGLSVQRSLYELAESLTGMVPA